MKHFYQDIQGCFTFAEFYAFIAKESATTLWRGVEIGSLYGQSAAHLAIEILNEGCESARLDLVELSDNRSTLLANLAPVSHVIGTIHSPCSSVAASHRYNDASLDFVMLDAGHDYVSVREDIDAWWPKIKIGGILATHDFCHYYPGLMRAWCETFEVFMIVRGSLWPDDYVSEDRAAAARADISLRSAKREGTDYFPVAWVAK